MPRRPTIGGIPSSSSGWWSGPPPSALSTLDAQALEGEFVPALFLVVWVSAALYALTRVARTLLGRFAGRTDPARSRDPRHCWDDGIDRPPPPALPPEAGGGLGPMPQVPGRRRRPRHT